MRMPANGSEENENDFRLFARRSRRCRLAVLFALRPGLSDFSAEMACPWIWFRQACQHGRSGRSHDDQNLCRSGTNKTGRDDNELVTGTSDIGNFGRSAMSQLSPLSAPERTWIILKIVDVGCP